MQANTIIEDSILTISYAAESDIDETVGNAKMVRTETRIGLNFDGDIHPDLLALAALLCVYPWTKSLTMSSPISAEFSAAVSQGTGTAIGPVSSQVSPRSASAGARPALAYSGGVDCTAALSVMPDTTIAYFLNRVTPPGEAWKGLYRKDAALHACRSLEEIGRLVRVIDTDLEFLRDPVGFPHDLGNAVPAILHAEHDNLDAVGWGAILESTYRVGALRFREYSKSPFVAALGEAFAAVGLPIYNAVAGVSEVGSALISAQSPFGRFAQSCMRGAIGEPCRRCWKCTRKILLEASLSGNWPHADEIAQMFKKVTGPSYLGKNPLKHEGVVAFFADRYPENGGSTLMPLLKEKVAGYSTDWMTKSYTPALDHVPLKYRDSTRLRLRDFLPDMSYDEIMQVRNWDIAELASSEARVEAHKQFLEAVALVEVGVTP